MIKKPSRKETRKKRHYRIRHFLKGTPEKPRLCVFRSNKHMYAQLIDDTNSVTIASASTKEKSVAEALEKTSDTEAAKLVGKTIARKAIDKGVKEVVFDRAGYIYHGKVAALADSAREEGLQF